MKIYKVYCEFFIKAENEKEAENIVINDLAYNNFMEEHIIIEESNCNEKDIFNRKGV